MSSEKSDYSWLSREDDDTGVFICRLCPHECRLPAGKKGICRSRIGTEHGIRPVHPAPVTAVAVDPVEKKPFFHYLPGKRILSIGFSGCNLKCPFCQNWHIARSEQVLYQPILPEELPSRAAESGSPGVAFTYSEPLIHLEYLLEAAGYLHDRDLRTLLVTNGYINREPGKRLAENMDGIKVDLKGYDEEWYRKELKGGLKPVLEFIETVSGVTHLEVVTLVIPGKNDSPKEIRKAARFLSRLNPEIPYHLTGYYPQYHYTLPPTDSETLTVLADTAREYLKHVYTGNTGLPNRTYCSSCGELLISRSPGTVRIVNLENGCCGGCGHPLYGVF